MIIIINSEFVAQVNYGRHLGISFASLLWAKLVAPGLVAWGAQVSRLLCCFPAGAVLLRRMFWARRR